MEALQFSCFKKCRVSTANTSETLPIVANNDTSDSNTDNNQNNPSRQNARQFDGYVGGLYDEVYLPESEDAIQMEAGTLTVELQTDQRVILFVEEYNEEYDEWYTVTASVSEDGAVVVNADIDNGLYAFSIVSLGQGGSFTLNANLTQ